MFTGIANYNSSVLNIYPNPAHDVLYIEVPIAIGMPMVVPNAFETTNHQHLSIALYDMLGKKVSAAADTFTKGENIYSINVSHLPKGLYIILVGDVMQKVVVD